MTFLCWLNFAVAAPHLPSEIAEWGDWVQEEHPEGACIDKKKSNCTWLGTLKLFLQNDEGRFILNGSLDAPDWVPLPGSADLWPVNVRLKGSHVPVLEREGQPYVYASVGDFVIEGTIVWNDLPNELPIPASTGVVQAHINDTPINVQLDEKGQVLLEQDNSSDITPPILTVSRLWVDGPTPTLTTHISVQNASQAQAVDLGNVGMENGTLIEATGSMSHWTDTQNHLFVYAPSGVHEFEYVHALEPQILNIPIPEPPSNWPSLEHWAIESHIDHRQINLTGLRPIATVQSLTPQSWHDHPTYTKNSDTIIEFDVLLRGNPSPPPNDLRQFRQIWPKLNGTGFWIQDEITGTMTQDWTLQPPPNLNIQSVEQSNFAQSIVEQRHSENTQSSIEIPIRTQGVDVTVISDTSDVKLPHGQWNTAFSDTKFVLWTPNTWMILYWDGIIWSTLLGALFNIALALVFTWRHRSSTLLNLPIVFGVGFGGLIAPTSTFIWQCVHWLCVDTKKHHWLFILSVCWGIFALHESQPLPIKNASQQQEHTVFMEQMPEEDSLYRNQTVMMKKDRSFYTQNNTQMIQMGIGLPTWTGEPLQKSWTDGQSSTEEMTLWILKPHQKRWIAMLAGFLILGTGWLRTNARSAGRAVLLVIGLVGALWTPREALAQDPSSTTVQHSSDLPSKEVEELLLEQLFPDDCQTDCVNIALSKVSIDENARELTIWMEVHAVEDAVLTLPGPIDQWPIDSVLWEGNRTHALRKSSDGYLEVRVPQGIWSIDIAGPLTDGLQIHWPILPHRMDTDTGKWIVQGMLENSQIEERIGLTQSTSPTSNRNHTGLIQWTKDVDLDTQWTVLNTLTRDEKDSDLALSIPLRLPANVQLLSSHGVATEDGWRISFPKGETSVSWTTVHLIEDQFTLEHTTLDNVPTSLTWRVQCGPTLHCEFEGPPPTTHISSLGEWIPTWHPYAGETLRIQSSPLLSKPGETTQVQSLHLHHRLTTDRIRSTAKFELESSASQPIEFTLPEDAVITSVKMNGVPYPYQPNQSLKLLTNIGIDKVSIAWTLPNDSLQHRLAAPSIDLPISNPTVTIEHENDMAIIWGSSAWNHNAPPLWSSLVLLGLMALGLARHPNSKRSFGLWIVTLMGIAHTGLIVGTLLLPLIIFQQLRTGSNRILLLEFSIVVTLLTSTYVLLITPAMSIWLWGHSNLNWYTDLVTEIPTLEVIGVPTHWVQSLWFIWLLWMLLGLLPPLFTDLVQRTQHTIKNTSSPEGTPSSDPESPSTST